jgi:hypothetical protein
VRSLLFPVLALGNASFLMAIIIVFAWIAAVAVRLATHQQSQQDQQATAFQPSLSPGRIRPDSYARTTACTRLLRSSFARILLTCVLWPR